MLLADAAYGAAAYSRWLAKTATPLSLRLWRSRWRKREYRFELGGAKKLAETALLR